MQESLKQELVGKNSIQIVVKFIFPCNHLYGHAVNFIGNSRGFSDFTKKYDINTMG